MAGCFGNSSYDRYLESLVDNYTDAEEEDIEDPRDEYYPELAEGF